MVQLNTGYLRRFERDAERNKPDAQYHLGLLYSTGQGVPFDMVTAHMWMNIAAMNGSPEARSLRAELARDMSPGEVAQAQRLARQWLARRLQ
jgi:TPR repeat protein